VKLGVIPGRQMKTRSLSQGIKSNQSTLAAKRTVKSPLSFILGSPETGKNYRSNAIFQLPTTLPLSKSVGKPVESTPSPKVL